MPLLFDPSWEYYEPDPEIAWAVYGRQPSGFEAVADERDPEKIINVGIRFGKGNPDFFHGRLARPKLKHLRADIENEERPYQRCQGCEELFQPNRAGRKFCSNVCRSVARQTILRLPPRTCLNCQEVFRPNAWPQKFCTPQCASRSDLAGAAHLRRRAAMDEAAFLAMWEDGTPLEDMATHFGVSVGLCRKRRRQLGLSPRPNRYYDRKATK